MHAKTVLAKIRLCKRLDFFEQTERIQELGEELLRVAPFNKLSGKLLRVGNGAIGPRFFIGQWAFKLLSKGIQSDTMIKGFEAAIAPDEAEFEEYTIVVGCDLKRRIRLNDQIEFVPSKQLFRENIEPQKLRYFAPFDRNGLTFFEQSTPYAAIVVRFKVKPLLVDESDVLHDEIEAREEVRDDVFRSLIISTDAPLRIAGKFARPVDRFNPAAFGGVSSPNSINPVFQHSRPDIRKFRRVFSGVRKFSQPEPLRLAIDSLVHARKAHAAAEKAAHLGMALEILLMHGDGGQTDQISFKLGLRAGWLLGKTASARQIHGSAARLLYDARSRAVHTGALGRKFAQRFEYSECEKLVINIACSIISIGRFPDWESLTYGGRAISH